MNKITKKLPIDKIGHGTILKMKFNELKMSPNMKDFGNRIKEFPHCFGERVRGLIMELFDCFFDEHFGWEEPTKKVVIVGLKKGHIGELEIKYNLRKNGR